MIFGDAIKRSITSFLKGQLPEKLIEEMGGEIVYTPEYFDELEADLVGENKDEEEPKDGDS